jgi:hypothetical protein
MRTNGPDWSKALDRWWPLVAVGALLAFAGIAAALSSPSVTPIPLPTSEFGQPTLPPGGPPASLEVLPTGGGLPEESKLPGWLAVLATVLCVLLVAAILVPLLWMLLRNAISIRRGELTVEQSKANAARPRDEVVAALDAGLEELSDTDRDPRRAVIACWVRLERAAADAGTPRQAGDTPTDLVIRLLQGHRVDRQVLDQFAEIYREARYATHPVEEHMRIQAQTALRHLRGELTAGAVGS